MDGMQNDPLADLLTEEQAAGLLLVSPKTLTDWRYRGKGPPVSRVGRAIRYQRSSLLAWFAENTEQPEKTASQPIRAPVFQAIEVRGERATNSNLVVWCPWCETLHWHGAAGGGGNRAAHCADGPASPLRATGYDLDVVGRAVTSDAVLPANPMVKQDQLYATLEREAPSLRQAVLKKVLGLRSASRDVISRHLGNGWLWVFGLSRWRIKSPDGATQDGEGLLRLFSELYGVPPGVVAVRLLEAVSAERLDAEAALGVQRAVDDWASRGAPKRGVRA